MLSTKPNIKFQINTGKKGKTSSSESQNSMDQRILKTIYFHPPGHGQGHLALDQGAQSPSSLGLNTAQGGWAVSMHGGLQE